MTGPASAGYGGARGALVALNVAGAAAATVFAAWGLVRPGYVQPGSPPTPLTRFWAASSAVRTWAVTGPLLVEVARARQLPPRLMTVAGLIQLGDAVLGVQQRNVPMTVLSGLMGSVHLVSARLLTR